MIFLTKGSNPSLLHCSQTLYHMSHQEAHVSVCVCVCVYVRMCIYMYLHVALPRSNSISSPATQKTSSCSYMVPCLPMIPEVTIIQSLCPFEFHSNAKIQSISFYVWLLSLSTISLRFISIVSCSSGTFVLITRYYFIV